MHHIAFDAFDPVLLAFANFLIEVSHCNCMGISLTEKSFLTLANFQNVFNFGKEESRISGFNFTVDHSRVRKCCNYHCLYMPLIYLICS